MLIQSYIETHKKIAAQVEAITKLTSGGSIEDNAFDIGREISRLSGLLNVHLNSEDRYLYPKLLESNDSSVKTLAKRYQDEMGGLIGEFNEFKSRYNTKTRILENKEGLAREWNGIVKKLSHRIEREENELYTKFERM